MLAGAGAVLDLFHRHRDLRRRAGQTHAQGFDRRGHGVRRVHAAARAGAGDGGGFDGVKLLRGHLALRVRADRFEDRDHVGVLVLAAVLLRRLARQD